MSELRLVPSAQDSPGDGWRAELKYELVGAEFGKVDEIMRVNHRHLVYAGEESVVHSVYFDDPRLSSLHESASGVGRRWKARLRWYDSPLPGTRAFFEIKRRRFDLVHKERVEITADAPLAGIGYRRLVRQLEALLSSPARELLGSRRTPVVLIRYRRRHYRPRRPGSRVRLTVDHDLVGFDQLGARSPRSRFGLPAGRRVILEVKCPPGEVPPVAELIHPLRARRTRCSKYLLCCEPLAQARGARSAL